MRNKKVDLHNHSIFSDGCLTPLELIDWAINLGLPGIAITDHNTLKGLKDAVKYAKSKPIKFVPGIEFDVKQPYSNKKIHILSLFVNPDNKYLLNLTKEYNEDRSSKKRRLPSIEKVIETIHLAKKPAILAHPGVLGKNEEKIIDYFKELGGDGIEVEYNYFPKFTLDLAKELTKKYRKIAIEKDFIISGGGDFHIKKDLRPIGEYGLTKKEFQDLEERIFNQDY